MASWQGVVKVKMLHRPGATVLLPEVVVITSSRNQWVQPQWVYAPTLAFQDGGAALATIHFAALDPARRLGGGLFGTVEFTSSDRIAVLSDRSEVYRCRISSPHSLSELTVGRGRLRGDGGINLRLFHHTTFGSLHAIRTSAHIRGSAWNYQGTRELVNIGYAYFTSLPMVTSELDLQSMAMASRGQLELRLDTSDDPDHADLVIDVYRGSTRDRQATLKLWVPSEIVSTPHIWQHKGPPVTYEIVHPWIYRVGLQPGGRLEIRAREAAVNPRLLKGLDYAVIGDCTTLAGLKAPFDEEDTTETFNVQDLGGVDLFQFWRRTANTDLHQAPTEAQQFKP